MLNTKWQKITIISASIALFIVMAGFIFILFKSISTSPSHEDIVVVSTPKMSYKECELKANQEYTDKIKLFGTPITVDGKKYDSLSKEQWEQLNSDRLKQIENCPRV